MEFSIITSKRSLCGIILKYTITSSDVIKIDRVTNNTTDLLVRIAPNIIQRFLLAFLDHKIDINLLFLSVSK